MSHIRVGTLNLGSNLYSGNLSWKLDFNSSQVKVQNRVIEFQLYNIFQKFGFDDIYLDFHTNDTTAQGAPAQKQIYYNRTRNI